MMIGILVPTMWCLTWVGETLDYSRSGRLRVGRMSAGGSGGRRRGWLGDYAAGSVVMGLLRTEAAMSYGSIVIIADVNLKPR